MRRCYSSAHRKVPKFSGRGQFNPETQKNEYIQEHDYTVTPESYLYLEKDNQEMFERFPLVNSKSLEQRKGTSRPNRVRMLARDFMDNSLYNSKYGYFSKAAEIYSPGIPFEFNKMRNADEFLDVWASDFGKKVSPTSNPTSTPAQRANEKQDHKSVDLKPKMRQMWHTPTELFHPYYGQALAKYIVEQHNHAEPLCIYEMGAGNGTLMGDIMDWIKENHPKIYKKMHYNIIEISPSLALRQKANSQQHQSRVTIHNTSVFDWDTTVNDKCFFIALEVWDNFAHDVVRYDNTTNAPHQGYVVVDQTGDFVQIFSEKLDTPLKRVLELREQLDYRPDPKLGTHPLKQYKLTRYVKNYIKPSQANLSVPDFVPTKYVDFLYILKEKFPNHSLLASDFTHFGDRIPGFCSPVVQTFVEGQPITVSTFMVLQGFFDIMFPTDFRFASQMYELVTGKKSHVKPHGQFLGQWADKTHTATNSGENPMLAFYRNASFLCTQNSKS